MKLKKLISAILTAVLITSAAVTIAASAEENDISLNVSKLDVPSSGSLVSEYYAGSNLNFQNYTNALKWARPVTSYLTECSDGTIMRFQWQEDVCCYLVEYYDSNFNLLSADTVELELPIFGGFYSDGSNHYVLSGESNYEEDDNAEVFRITKYDKDWRMISRAGIYGANTVEPFAAGSARMDVCGKYLLIRTSHKMYADSNGTNHQANVTIEYDTSNGMVTDSYTAVMNSKVGYISHSFNQFIKVENNKIVAVDHGDAYPRSITLVKYQTDVSGGKFKPDYFNSPCTIIDAVSMQGSIGQNYTGVSVGGFEISSTNYLIAGNIVADPSKYNSSSATRNIYISAVSKTDNSVKLNYITNYADGELGVQNPQFVKIANDRFLLLWTLKGQPYNLYYTEIDKNGDQTGPVYQGTAGLSDCLPVVINNKLCWYVWYNNKVNIYQINLSNISECNRKTIDYNNPVVNKSSLANSTINSGEFANLSLNAAGGSGTYTYSVNVRKQGSTDVLLSKTNLTSTNYNFTFSSTGTFDVEVIATDSDGNSAVVHLPLTIVNSSSEAIAVTATLSASVVTPGTKVTITSKASGGSGEYTHALSYKSKSAASWTSIGSVTAKNVSGSVTLNSVGEYEVRTIVTDSAGNITTKILSLTVSNPLTNTSTISSSKIETNEKLVITGSASGGAGNYKYAFYYKKASANAYTIKGTEFGSDTSVNLYPASAEKYTILVKVRDNKGTVAEKTFTVDVSAGLKNGSYVSKKEVYTGDKLTVKGLASGGAGNYKYAFYFKQHKNSTWKLKGTEFGNDTSVDIYPSYVDTYDVKVIVKDSAGKTVSKTFAITVKKGLKNESSVSKNEVKKGEKLTVKGSASGGAGSYKYAFYFKQHKNSTWKLKGTEFGSASSVYIYPAYVGMYDIKVIVKDSSGKTVTKTFNVDVKK